MHSDHYFRGILSPKTPSTCLVKSPKPRSSQNCPCWLYCLKDPWRVFLARYPRYLTTSELACLETKGVSGVSSGPSVSCGDSLVAKSRPGGEDIHIYTIETYFHIQCLIAILRLILSTRCWSEVRFHHCHRHLASEAPRSFWMAMVPMVRVRFPKVDTRKLRAKAPEHGTISIGNTSTPTIYFQGTC